MLVTTVYKDNLVAIVTDEAHCFSKCKSVVVQVVMMNMLVLYCTGKDLQRYERLLYR